MQTMEVFDRRAQRAQALVKANRVRGQRAMLKRELKAGRRHVIGVLSDPPAFIDTMKVFDLLVSVPKVGEVKALRTLKVCVVSPSRPVGRLSSRERADLARLVA